MCRKTWIYEIQIIVALQVIEILYTVSCMCPHAYMSTHTYEFISLCTKIYVCKYKYVWIHISREQLEDFAIQISYVKTELFVCEFKCHTSTYTRIHMYNGSRILCIYNTHKSTWDTPCKGSWWPVMPQCFLFHIYKSFWTCVIYLTCCVHICINQHATNLA